MFEHWKADYRCCWLNGKQAFIKGRFQSHHGAAKALSRSLRGPEAYTEESGFATEGGG